MYSSYLQRISAIPMTKRDLTGWDFLASAKQTHQQKQSHIQVLLREKILLVSGVFGLYTVKQELNHEQCYNCLKRISQKLREVPYQVLGVGLPGVGPAEVLVEGQVEGKVLKGTETLQKLIHGSVCDLWWLIFG